MSEEIKFGGTYLCSKCGMHHNSSGCPKDIMMELAEVNSGGECINELSEIDKEIDKHWEIVHDLRKKRKELLLGDLKNKIMNQFIEFKEEADSKFSSFLKVYEIFQSGENQILIRGCGFYGLWTPYWDACEFKWDRAIDEFLNLDKINTAIEDGLIRIIDKEEFVAKFKEEKEKLDKYFNEQLDKIYEE